MTKVELARAVATKMYEENNDVNVERMTIIFTAQRTKSELEAALRGVSERRTNT